MAGESLDRVEINSRVHLRDWLEHNHQRSKSVWLVLWKKAAGDRYVPYDDIVEEALCFGWVDSLPRRLDEHRSMLLLSPRTPRSAWSAVNKARVEKLTALGLFHPAGLAVIAAAKANGNWEKLDAVETLLVPPDLAAALAALPPARDHFDAFPPSTRRGILEWIVQAKRPETRARRVAETAGQAARNIRANQYRQPKGAD